MYERPLSRQIAYFNDTILDRLVLFFALDESYNMKFAVVIFLIAFLAITSTSAQLVLPTDEEYNMDIEKVAQFTLRSEEEVIRRPKDLLAIPTTPEKEKNVLITLRDPQEIADRLKGIPSENKEEQ